MNLNKYFEEGLSYSAYINEVKERLSNIEKAGDPDGFAQYYSMNLKRMERLDKTFQLTDEQKTQIKNKNLDFRLMTISEGWCGDAAQSVPVVQKMMEEFEVENRFVFRDDNRELMDAYLTDGARGIPIFIGIDKDGNELFHFGPRPKHGMDMLKKHKDDPENYTETQFHQDLQVWYNEDKGVSTFNEFMETMN